MASGSPHRIDPVKPRPDRVLAPISDRLTAHRFCSLVRELERAGDPIDVVHAHFYTGARALVGACRSLEIPLIVTEHSTRLTGRSAAHKPFTRRNQRTAHAVYAGAARVIAVSDYLRRCIEDSGLARHVDVIPNPVEPLTACAPIAERGRLIVSVGRLEADKDPIALLDAMALVVARHPDACLVVIGDGPLRAEVEARSRMPDIAGHVQVTGPVSRDVVASHLAQASCFALASRVETFCIAAAEAVLAGVPVVMPRLPPVTSVVGGFGILIDRVDPDLLARSISSVLDADPGAWPQVERDELRDRLAPSRIGARLAEIYEQVASRP